MNRNFRIKFKKDFSVVVYVAPRRCLLHCLLWAQTPHATTLYDLRFVALRLGVICVRFIFVYIISRSLVKLKLRSLLRQ